MMAQHFYKTNYTHLELERCRRRSWQCGWRPARGASVPCRRSPCTRRCGAACSLDWCAR